MGAVARPCGRRGSGRAVHRHHRRHAARRFRAAAPFHRGSGGGAGGDVLGFASWFPLYSSIRARDYLFLDNLYVRPQARGGGGRVARLLIAHVAADAVVWQADRLELHVRQPNDRARRFYTRTGIDATGVIVHGAGSDGLARLAADGEAG
ncbi:GNAT family N-acetyltransferase [Tistrella bauzanensis]